MARNKWSGLMVSKLIIAFAVLLKISSPAAAIDVVKVGKPFPEGVVFAFLEVAQEKGFFKKHNIAAEITVFNGGGAQNQGLAAGVVDAVLSSGSSMALVAKNAPFIAVAEIMGPPLNIAVITKPDSGIKTADDLKGKRIAVTANTSVTALLPRQLAILKGWGKDGITTVSLGGGEAQWAGVISGNADAMVSGTELGQSMEAKGTARVPFLFGSVVTDYVTHVIFATKSFTTQRPDVLKRFVAGCLEAIAWSKQNPAEAAKIIAQVIRLDEKVTLKLLTDQLPGFYSDGKFRESDVTAIVDEYMRQELFTTRPTPSQLYTEAFLPK